MSIKHARITAAMPNPTPSPTGRETDFDFAAFDTGSASSAEEIGVGEVTVDGIEFLDEAVAVADVEIASGELPVEEDCFVGRAVAKTLGSGALKVRSPSSQHDSFLCSNRSAYDGVFPVLQQ